MARNQDNVSEWGDPLTCFSELALWKYK